MEIIQSNKGKPKIAFNGYIYRQNTTNITTQNWRCELKGCNGSASTAVSFQVGGTVIERRTHNHPPDPARVEISTAVNRMLESAATSSNAPRRIISEIEMSHEAQSLAPKRKSLSQRIVRKRRRLEIGYEAEPQNRASIHIPEKFRTVKHGVIDVRFLLHEDDHDEHNEDNRIIVFASDLMLDELERNDVWMLDGTFKVSPSLFLQLYTIHVVIGGHSGHVFPCVYALLPDKSTATYKRLFEILRNARPNLAPRTCIIDFEAATKRAIEENFPQVSVQGCFFHLTQSVWRKVQNVGLVEEYKNSDDVRNAVKSLCSLAFLEESQINEAFEELQEISDNMNLPKLTEVYNYFEDTYIGRLGRRGQRRAANFGKIMWNVRSRTEEGIPRTNNKIEGWHRAIQGMVDSPHPSLWRFLAAIQKEEALQAAEIFKFKAGNEIQRQEKKYIDINKRLKVLIRRLVEEIIDRKEFLRGVGYNISLNV